MSGVMQVERFPLALTALILGLCLVGGCGGGGRDAEAPAEVAAYDEAQLFRAQLTASPGDAEPAPLAQMVAAQKLIRTATLTVEVESFDSAALRITEIARSSGGYVADSRRSRDTRGASQGVVTLRVPTERYEAALTALRELGEVDDESQSTEDVTKAYTDLETRLGVKRQAADRLRDILRNRTGDLSDVLQVERELARLVEEIERLEGERRYYDHQIALSTVTVSIHEPGARAGGGPLTPVVTALRDSLRTLSRSAGVLIYAVAYVLPWLLLAAVVWWGARRARAALARWRPAA